MIKLIRNIICCVLFTCFTLNLLILVESKPQTTSGTIQSNVSSSTNHSLLPNITSNTSRPVEHQHLTINGVPQTFIPATVIERGENFSNGCYREIVKEPFYSDPQRFVSYEQLICPPSVNLTTLTPQHLKPLHPPSHEIKSEWIKPPNTTVYSAVPFHASEHKNPSLPSLQSHGGGLSQNKGQPDVVEQNPPVFARKPDVPHSQVILLSQTTGYYDTKRKTNSANTNTLLLLGNWNVTFIVIITLFTYYCFM